MLTSRQRLLLLFPFVLIVGVFLLLPALFGFLASFTNYVPFRLNIQFVGVQNYVRLLDDDIFRFAVLHIVLITSVAVPTEMAVGFVLAYALRRPFRGRSIIRFLLILPWLISPAASGVMWHNLLNTKVGLMNFWPALLRLPDLPYTLSSGAAFWAVVATEIWRKAPFVTALTLPSLLSIPVEQWDLARMDGARLSGQIRHIALPPLRPLLFSILLLLVGDTLGISESVFFLTGGGPGSMTITPGLYSFVKAVNTFDWSKGAIAGWLTILSVVLLGAGYLSVRRNLQRQRWLYSR